MRAVLTMNKHAFKYKQEDKKTRQRSKPASHRLGKAQIVGAGRDCHAEAAETGPEKGKDLPGVMFRFFFLILARIYFSITG
jgi:hypothetical protein